jgi:hypothetical protein
MFIFRWIWNGLTGLVGLILPLFGKARDFRFGPRTRWILHYVIVFLVLALLAYLNYAFDLERFLEAPWLPLRRLWLPLLFLIAYLLVWLGWWLYQLLGPDRDPVEFPDIDSAWAESLQALEQAGIDVTETPLFLVLGRTAAPEDALFAAAHMSLRVQQTPRNASAPLHIYANKESIYVTCPGASLLGRQSALLNATETELAAGTPGSVPQADADADPGASGMTSAAIQEGEPEVAAEAMSLRTLQANVGPELRRKKARERIPVAEEGDEPVTQSSTRQRRVRPLLLKNTDEVALLKARLRHLCRLIARTRRPSCPVNGILVLLPFAALDNDVDATQTGLLCQIDLNTTRASLQLYCSIFALVCDLEQAVGFREFMDRFPKALRQRRVGQHFPFVPDLDPAEVASLVESGVTWVFHQLLPPLVYRLLRVEAPGRQESAAVLRGNVRLFKLLAQMRDRHQRLARLLTLALALDRRGPLHFAGFYLGGTGRDANREQAFVAGVFRRLIENQDFVSWTDAAVVAENKFQRWTGVGYSALASAIGLLVLAGMFASRR